MPDINPYEPPQTPRPLKPGQFTKRGLGVVLILLLMPPAVGAALLAGCTLANSIELGPLDQLEVYFLIAIAFVPPIATFGAMLWWAIWVSKRSK